RLVGQLVRLTHRLCPAGQLGAVRRRDRAHAAAGRSGRPGRHLPGRRLRAPGARDMTSVSVERLRPGHRDRVGESPLWDSAQRAWWWVDIEACAVRRLRLADGALQSWALPERVACVALHADGGLVAALETRIVHATLHA